MRRLAEVRDAKEAAQLQDVLLGRKVRTEVREGELWVLDDADLPVAREVFASFRADPASFKAELAAGAQRRAEDRKADEAWKSRLRLARQSIHGADGRGWLTIGVLGMMAVVAATSNFGSRVDLLGPVFLTTHAAGDGLLEVAQGQVWRLITPIFIHFGMLHLAGNGLMWWSLAGRIENRKGMLPLALLVLWTGIGANLAQHGWNAWSDPSGVSLVGGLSGVVYGLFGFAWLKGRYDPLDELEVPPTTFNYMIGWLILCMTGAVGPVANAAHVGGLVLGCIAAGVDIGWFHWRKHR